MQAKKKLLHRNPNVASEYFLRILFVKKSFLAFREIFKESKVSSHFPLIRECTDKPVNIWNRFYFILLMRE